MLSEPESFFNESDGRNAQKNAETGAKKEPFLTIGRSEVILTSRPDDRLWERRMFLNVLFGDALETISVL